MKVNLIDTKAAAANRKRINALRAAEIGKPAGGLPHGKAARGFVHRPKEARR